MSTLANERIESADRKPLPTHPISFEEFLEWVDEDQHVEWVNGKVVPMPPVADEHADVAEFLRTLLRLWVEAKDAGIVRSEPVLMKTGPDLPARAPDVLFLAKENLERRKKTFIDGPADLVIEVISPDSTVRDRREKFAEYQQGGVKEYWLIDPERRQADFYQRGDDGLYRSVPADDAGIYRSAVLPGLWLRLAWLEQRPLPTVLSVLREWKLV
jgi:Uma2 family endonuclease